MTARQTTTPIVYAVSDSAGETGEAVIKAAAAQFYPVRVDIRVVPFVSDTAGVDKVIREARDAGAVIVFTLVIPQLRDYLVEQATACGIMHIDLLGPIIGSLENMLRQKASHRPGMLHALDADYFRKVEAIEFAVKYDDGRDPSGILKADIVLLGVSRTSKTPLSMYLAHKKYKVANVPIVPELRPPDELQAVSAGKIIGLTINPHKLNAIRKERLKTLGLADNAIYADMERIRQELDHADKLFARLGCAVIDVSDKAVEETASVIVNLISRKPS